MTTTAKLPAGFEALEPFATVWAIEGSAARAQLRLDQGEAGCCAFYNAAKDLLAPALVLLDKKPLKELDETEQRLLNLMLSFAHASLVAEVQRDDEPRHAADARHVRITTTPADHLC